VQFVALKDGIDTTEPSIARILISIFGLVSELEIENIKHRVNASLLKRNREGKSYGGRYVNLGYDRITNNRGESYFAVIDDEAEVIRMIYESYNEGLSARDIAINLNNMNYKTRTNNIFTESSVIRILKNPIYIGKIRLISNNKTSKQKLIDGMHEPIISLDTWNNVQMRLKENKVVKKKSEEYLFSGKIICYKCGARMYGIMINGKQKQKYYKCHHVNRVKSCDAPAIRADVVDKMFINEINLMINTTKFKDFMISILIREVYKANNEFSDTSALENEIKSLEIKKNKFIDQYVKGVIREASYNKGIELFNIRIDSLKSQYNYLCQSIYIIDPKSEIIIKKDVKSFITKLSKILDNENVKRNKIKNEIIKEVVVEIKYKNIELGELEIEIKISNIVFARIIGAKREQNYKEISFNITYID
jgi:site-specific DNA recombinase